KQTISVPALLLLTTIVLYKGADLGVKALYVVVFTLALSLVAFFAGSTDYSRTHDLDPFAKVGSQTEMSLTNDSAASQTTPNDTVPMGPILKPASPNPSPAGEQSALPIGFFTVFAIIFPAFTGMTAGVGLSGDLENPSRSIPLGTLAGTLGGMLIYFLIAYKLAISASPEALANTDQLVMSEIAWQGWWVIPVGLAAATISSALGSILVAPRTLQAIARDRILPSPGFNQWLSKGKGKNDEPRNATIITIGIAFVFVMMGGLDAVAEIISMFFMVTYGSLCLISFLQHFSADPSYRPTFKSRWYVSLFGALACLGLMIFMNAGYALLALLLMVVFYLLVSLYNSDKKNLAVIFQGVIFQLSRQLQVFLQKANKEQNRSWRPSVVCISESSFKRFAAFDLLRWISQTYGFGTYIHKITGYLSKSTNREAKQSKNRLIKMVESSNSNIYVDTLISPSYTSAIAQVIQLPGISGTENNLLMFEYSKSQPENLSNIIDNFKLITSVDFDVIIVGSSERGYGFKRSIHVWITASDYDNANLMILLAYIVLGHKEWSNGVIKIFAIYPEATCDEERKQLFSLIEQGQLPISPNNIEVIPQKPDIDSRTIIYTKSSEADLCILGFRGEAMKQIGADLFEGYDGIGNTVFVNAAQRKIIK
ncbi:MAG: amino acid permease, partial [Bacteroidota bacterium]